MPFLDQTFQREINQTVIPFKKVNIPSFGDVFGASLGQVFDEGLSISSNLNREGWQERAKQIREMVKSEAVDGRRYTNKRGRFNYSKFAIDHEDLGIKTDATLNEERNALLKQRREYAQDVIERGSGMAQFLGAANGYILDPLNIATIGFSTVAVGAKSLTVAGKALLTARNTAVLTAATELAIQPLVYSHKQDIESPYSTGEAIQAIAFAAIGGGAIGGITGGISGYLSKVIGATDNIVKTAEVQKAVENLESIRNTLRNAPQIDTAQIKKEFIAEGGAPEGLNKALHDAQVEADSKFLTEIEEVREASKLPSKTMAQYEIAPEAKAVDASITARQREVLADSTEDFNRDMAKFNEIDKPIAFVADEPIDARKVIADLDKEMEGLDSVLVCANA